LPVVSMVPREELPPEVELTDQVTEVLEEPVTVAVKGRVEPARTLAVVGEMEMVGAGVGPGVGVGWGELEEPQEIRTRARRDTSAKRKSLRSIEDIVGIVSKGRRRGTTGRRDRKRAVVSSSSQVATLSFLSLGFQIFVLQLRILPWPLRVLCGSPCTLW
jgi:hypothetical protein